MTFDPTIHLGDIINVGLGAIVTAIGWGVRRAFHGIKLFVENVGEMDIRLEDTAGVVDTHSDIIKKAGLSKVHLQTVSKKRRREDHGILGLSMVLLSVSLTLAACGPVPPPPTPPLPPVPPQALRAVAIVVLDSTVAVTGATCQLQTSEGWITAEPSNADGYVLWPEVSVALRETAVQCSAIAYVTATESRVLRTGENEDLAAISLEAVHVDPSAVSTEKLMLFRGSLFTVKAGNCDLPYGPRPHQPDNVAFFAVPYYTPEQRQCVYQLWRNRNYTHGPIGPFIDPGYHGEVPSYDIQDGAQWGLNLLQEVWDAHLVPEYFVIPDHCGADGCGGKFGPWANHVWTVAELRGSKLEAVYKSPEFQRLARIVVLCWECQGSKYGWSTDQYVEYLTWLADTFPTAIRGLHTIADIEAPVGNGDDTSRPGHSNGESWARITPLIHFWLHQSSALFNADHVADNGKTDSQNWLALWDRTSPFSFPSRFGRGTAGWPTTSASGSPLCVVAGEYYSFVAYWQNRPEEQAREWGQQAVRLGACGFNDGGREP